jgi:hypothetical protein
MSYEKGSEWRRWDLHIHTPGTLKGDKFKGKDLEEKWDYFYKDVNKYIGDGKDPLKAIAAIGITDYLSIDNYKKVISDGYLKNITQLIFPNIELRLTISAEASPVNIHCIFNPEIADEIEDLFLNKLIKNYKGIDYSATTRDLIRYGKVLDKTLDDYCALKKGKEQFPISFEAFQNALVNPRIKENCIVVVSGKSNDGLSGITEQEGYYDETTGISQLLATRENITYFVDAIFSAAPSDIRYFSGQKESIKIVKSKYRSLKPCLIGCDAHCNDKIFEPDNKKYCWVKADTTFNGLKQILFEPTERVKISELQPFTKKDYYVIEKVVFDDENFSPEPIYFNEGLTCIIGGKSTGKSILLNNMASKIDKKQVDDKYDKVNPNLKNLSINNIAVYWRDGEEAGKNKDRERKIIYIPQAYLNRLSDDYSEKTEIDDIIQEIILQNAEAKTIYDKVYNEITEVKTTIDKKIYDLLLSHKRLAEIENSLKENGNSKDIEKSLTDLKKQKDILVKDIEISDKDILEYDNAIARTRQNNIDLDTNERNVEELKTIDSLFDPRELDFKFNDFIKMSIDAELLKQTKIIRKEWRIKQEKLIKSIEESNIKIKENLAFDNIIITKIQPQIETNEAVSIITKQIQKDDELLEKAKQYEVKLNELQKKCDEILESIVTNTYNHKYIHNNFAEYIENNPTYTIDDMVFKVRVPFRAEKYINKVKDIFDKRKLKTIIEGLDDITENDYDEKHIKMLLDSIINSDGDVLKKGCDIEEALRIITSDWFNVTYTIDMEGDTIREMSPGKKALVLLKLLISLAESNCPILIDQPEDDLDNRSIYYELVEFIKKKKKERQIILVTHNANIVLGCDAEEVIIANQEGKNAANHSKRFEYRSGSIENNEKIYESGKIKKGILNEKGIQEQICEILEGGPDAFKIREQKYIL